MNVLRIGYEMLEAADLDGWCALHHAASQGHERLVRALLAAGSDPLAVTGSGMRVGALAAQGRFFEIRNILERAACTAAAYRGVELEELDKTEQAELEADMERGRLLPSLAGEGRRKILKRRREDAESRRKASGMAQKGKSKKAGNTRLKMGVSSGVGGALNGSMTMSLPSEEAEAGLKGDPLDALPTELFASVQQVAPPTITMLVGSVHMSAHGSTHVLDQLKLTEQMDADKVEAGVVEGEDAHAKLRWRKSARSVLGPPWRLRYGALARGCRPRQARCTG